jgi:aminopeptidase N
MPFNDPSSQSNFPFATVKHVDFDVNVDFDAKEIVGTVSLRVTVADDGVSTLVLDTRELKIEQCTVDGEKSDAASTAFLF